MATLHKPSDESVLFMNRYLKKVGTDTLYSYKLSCAHKDSLRIAKHSMNNYKLATGGKASALQIRMYDSLGRFIYGWEQCFGDLQKSHILDSLPFKENKYLLVNKNLSLLNDICLLDISKIEQDVFVKEIQKNEYTILVLWAGWTGWYGRNMFRQINKYLKIHQKNHKILFLKLNTTTNCIQ